MIRDHVVAVPLSTEDLFKRLYAPMLLDNYACTFQIEWYTIKEMR